MVGPRRGTDTPAPRPRCRDEPPDLVADRSTGAPLPATPPNQSLPSKNESANMTQEAASVAVLGSTGSIGRSALAVIAAQSDSLRIAALSAHASLDRLVEQAQTTRPRWVVASDPLAAAAHDWSHLPNDVELLVGPEGLEAVARQPDIDIVVAAIVGSAGLRGTWAAVEAGKTVALANKETMVVAGPLVTELARTTAPHRAGRQRAQRRVSGAASRPAR